MIQNENSYSLVKLSAVLQQEFISHSPSIIGEPEPRIQEAKHSPLERGQD